MNRNKIKRIFLLGGLVCVVPILILGVSMSVELYRYFNPYLDQDITGPVTIPDEWLELVPNKPLRVERQIQKIVLDLDKSVKLERDGWGLVLPDGSIVQPAVQLIDENGQVYNLDVASSWSNPSTGVTYREFSMADLPKDKSYRMVRLRSAKPVPCRRVFWRSYNQWDVS
ncbi:MAG TPA: hypothetical protein VJU84_02350 [Pyrinomonadaceae bacterium]|nr:hypothetical protein [Pyrinomonadaceae bacterium]